jgi:hypothetical protein
VVDRPVVGVSVILGVQAKTRGVAPKISIASITNITFLDICYRLYRETELL